MVNTITSIEFIKLCNAHQNIIGLKDYSVEGELKLIPPTFNGSGVELSNCVFKDKVIIANIESDFWGFSISQCRFERGLEFHNVCFDKSVMNESSLCDGIIIETSEIKDRFLVRNSKINKGIQIYDSKLDVVLIRSMKSDSGGLNFSDTSVNKNITISQSQIGNELRIAKTTVKEWMKIENLFSSFYVFQGNLFEGRLMIWAGSAKGGITFNNGVYNEEIKIESVITEGGLTVSGDLLKKALIVKYYDITNNKYGGPQSFFLNSCSFENGLIVDGEKTFLEKAEIKQIQIPSTNLLSGLIQFVGLTVHEVVSISGVNKSAHIVFKNVQIQEVRFEYFTNYGYLQFIDVRSTREGKSNFLVLNSDLGKTSFHNTFLDSFSDVDIVNSNLTQITSSYIRWFNPQQILNKSKESNDFGRNRDLFRQLKFAMLKQGDRVQALFFKKYEMVALSCELNKAKGRSGEKFMMWLNKSNDYGQDWIRPIWLGVLVTVILYIFLIIAVAPELSSSFSFRIENLINTCSVIPKYSFMIFKLLNPTHIYSSLIPSIRDNLFGNLIDVLQRITISYFIFQTISAFRKYIRE